MTFTPEQIEMLAAPLDPANVKPPPQGKYGEYIEGWKAIEEANRIFGFDGWTSQTELVQVGGEVEIDGKWRISYRATCTISVDAIIRQGCGFGQGIDRDIGQAHESALKEAETDARKRALMTFGYPFGLALYDKTKANVQAPHVEAITDAQRDEITIMAQGAGVELQAICQSRKIGSLKDLPAAQFEGVVNKLKLTMAKNAAEQKETT